MKSGRKKRGRKSVAANSPNSDKDENKYKFEQKKRVNRRGTMGVW